MKQEYRYIYHFNPITNISFQLPVHSFVTLKVYNILGQEVAIFLNEKLEAGKHNVSFDASKLSSAVYFYRIVAGSFVQTKKMIIAK